MWQRSWTFCIFRKSTVLCRDTGWVELTETAILSLHEHDCMNHDFTRERKKKLCTRDAACHDCTNHERDKKKMHSWCTVHACSTDSATCRPWAGWPILQPNIFTPRNTVHRHIDGSCCTQGCYTWRVQTILFPNHEYILILARLPLTSAAWTDKPSSELIGARVYTIKQASKSAVMDARGSHAPFFYYYYKRWWLMAPRSSPASTASTG